MHNAELEGNWERESAQMGKVYSNGHLNIATTAQGTGRMTLQRMTQQLPLVSTVAISPCPEQIIATLICSFTAPPFWMECF